MGKIGRNRKFAHVVLGAVGLLSVASMRAASAAGEDPPRIINEGAISVPAEGTTIRVSANDSLLFEVFDGDGLVVECVGLSQADGECDPQRGFVTLKVTRTKAEAKGTLLVSIEETGRSDSRSMAAAADARSAQPKKLTVPLEGCAGWYATELFGCDHDKKPDPLDKLLEPPTGKAVVDGSAGTGVFEVTKAATAETPAAFTITGVDGFGESSGSLGSKDDEWALTVRRRAPIAFGVIVVLFGAAAAAAVGWYADRAQKKSDEETARAGIRGQAQGVDGAPDGCRPAPR